ncbi:Poly-beta-1,6-N-acetyl-D-glucosamine export protein precursor [Serratia entomophila]|uniref:poly-beta-1,6 N-acetyl-D-glucosamine export porin PgaA n=1 Tax=Serratia entomophila TaxID=42906 RepID=UPI002177A3D0|nr:poly-beta-1,6 N-acetyl-D-glucosamine export porin PgaA [Serratia entomophila]CAI0698666.1 Poly-beta-1,6-N-acetyl-D-glucosamine export protein precursor [Serratia entomophila]
MPKVNPRLRRLGERYPIKYAASLLFIGLALPPGALADEHYDGLIRQARAGNTGPVLAYLSQRRAHDGLNPQQQADFIQVAGWAGRDQEIVDLWQADGASLPRDAASLAAVARAYRNLKQWPPSLRLWRAALRQTPADAGLQRGYVMTLADAGQDLQAQAEAARLNGRLDPAAYYLTRAYVDKAGGRPWAALENATRARALAPADDGIRQYYVTLLAANRVAGPALVEGASLPADQLRRLQADEAAELVRLSFVESRGEQQRFTLADRALARYDQLLAQWRTLPDAQVNYQQARIDRLGALLARSRMADVVAGYQALLAEGRPVPDYAQRWAASAYLYLRQPDQAQAIFSRLNAAAPQRIGIGAQTELFYAQAENEQIDRAALLAQRASQQYPYFVRLYRLPTLTYNDDWLAAQILRQQALIYQRDLPEAERHITHLARTAPGNQGLRIALAGVYQARGWPRRAEEELKQVEGLDPRSLALEIQQGYVAQDLQEWRQMDLLADDVMRRAPESVASQQLERSRRIHHMSELRVSGNQGIDSDGPISGTHDFGLRAALYSAPIDDNWRLFTGWGFTTGQFTEGKGINRDLSAGAEWRSRDGWLEAEAANRNFGHGNQLGLRLSGWHDVNDQWRIGGAVARLSADTPLRAMTNGISANGGNLWLRWQQNESRELRASVAPSHFSDGNNRLEYGVEGRQRLLAGGRYTLDMNLTLAGSRNSLDDAPYYNPKSDFTLMPSVTFDSVLYRHYQTQWSQQIQAGAGSYWQQDYARKAITQLGYGQRIGWGGVLDAGAMLQWEKHPYDGKRERNISLTFDLNYRF